MDRYGLRVSLPASVVASIEEAEKDDPVKAVNRYQVLLDNQNAIEAAATAAGQLEFAVEVAHDINEQQIEEGVSILISRLISLKEKSPHNRVCLISGGEFSCAVRGTGVGGRNLETVLRCALELDRNEHRLSFNHFVALSAGTDGIDGNSNAAGAIADQDSFARAVALGLDAEGCLQNSDAFNFFSSLGDAIITGPTGTNVRDLRILMA
jgi:hydroxypyruvate reductase